MGALTIGQVARDAGVGVETVRFYERQGLIEPPPRDPVNRYRRYPEAAVRRIVFIRQAQSLGFSLREIAELLSLRANPGASCGDVRHRAEAKLAEINRKRAQLEVFRAALEELIAACPGNGTAARACTILQFLEQTVDQS